jgi:cytochrome c biogenesis protein CcmG/thiol:disulfide interchange protein DsbE
MVGLGGVMDDASLNRRTLLGLIAAGAAMRAAPAMTASPRVGEVAPEFQLSLVDDSRVRLADLRGHVILLNFWATWCAPCRVELPLLDRYYRARRANGLRVFAVSTEEYLPLNRLRELFRTMAIPSARRVRGPYAPLGAMPTNFVIDRAGRVRHAAAGVFTLASLNRLLIPLLSERAPRA